MIVLSPIHLRVVAVLLSLLTSFFASLLASVLLSSLGASAALAQQMQSVSASQSALLIAAKALLAERKYSEALQILAVLAKKDPLNAELFRCLGDSYLALEQQDGAVSAYERSLALEPSNEAVVLVLAKLYREREQSDTLRQWYDTGGSSITQPEGVSTTRSTEKGGKAADTTGKTHRN